MSEDCRVVFLRDVVRTFRNYKALGEAAMAQVADGDLHTLMDPDSNSIAIIVKLLAAYNGGPGRVARGRAMPLESLQYALGVGDYRSVLKVYEPSVRAHAAELGLVRSRRGDDWWTLSRRLQVPLIQLRLYNPFLSDQRLHPATHLIAYPQHPVRNLFGVTEDDRLEYRVRIGDNYINLAFAFGVDVDGLRSANELWRLQLLRPDMVLTIPLDSTEALMRAPRPSR